MTGKLAPRYWLFWLGLTVTAISLMFALTPWWYSLERFLFGVPDEYYPELAWFALAVYVGLPLTLVGGVVLWITRRQDA